MFDNRDVDHTPEFDPYNTTDDSMIRIPRDVDIHDFAHNQLTKYNINCGSKHHCYYVWLVAKESGEGEGRVTVGSADIYWERMPWARNPLCQSENHTSCYGSVWECSECSKKVCQNEAEDGEDANLCDDCWSIKHKIEKESTCTTN